MSFKRPHTTPLSLLTLATLALFGCGNFRPPGSVVRTIAAVKALPASAGSPTHVLIQGVVTYWDPAWRMAFVQDETGGLKLPTTAFGEQIFQQGKRIEIEAQAQSGGLEPILLDPTVRLLGGTVKPAPAKARLSDLKNARYDDRLVRVEGVLQSAEPNRAGRYRLKLATHDGRLTAWVADSMNRKLHDLEDADVALTGIVSQPMGGGGEASSLTMWARTADDVEVLRAPAELKTMATSELKGLLAASGAPTLHRVRLQGRLMVDEQRGGLVFRNGEGALNAVAQSGETPHGSGSQSVYGFLDRAGGTLALTGAFARAGDERARTASGSIEPLRTVERVHALRPDQAAEKRPVHLSAVVTYVERQTGFLFVQDGTGGIYIPLDHVTPKNQELRTGDLVEIDGTSAPGDFAPIVDWPRVKFLRRGTMPRPASAPAEVLFSGSQDGNWVELEGIVAGVRYEDYRPLLNMSYGAHSFQAMMPASARLPDNLTGSTVRLGGVCGTQFNERRQLIGINLFVPSERYLRVLKTAGGDLPLRPIRQVMQFTPTGTDFRVRVEAVVTYTRLGGPTFVQDASGGILLRNHDRIGLHVGDRIGAEGAVAQGEFGPLLENVHVVRLGAGTLPRAVRTAADEVVQGDHGAELIQVEGKLVNAVPGLRSAVLVMESRGVLFTAHTDGTFGVGDLQLGSVMRLSGVCYFALDPVESAMPNQFELLLRGADDIELVQRATWWNPQRTLVLAGSFALLIVLSTLWNFTLRRRVVQQTELIRTKLEREAQLEGQLAQAQKLESIGRLAGGVAHDFNNLLTVINGYSGLLLARLRAGDAMRAPLEAIQHAGERAADLTQQLLAFSRKQLAQPKPVNLNDLITGTEDMLRRLVGEDIAVIFAKEPSLASVTADPGQIHQVLMNLAANARDAMPKGGELRIRTRNVMLDAAFAATHRGTASGKYVLLEVSDTGLGMDEETRSHIFEPFFTTKDRGRGTGLGLATVYGIVRQNSGVIEVESNEGRGTIFRIYLPRGTDAPRQEESRQSTLPGLEGSETVLIVEDLAPVRRLAVEVLTTHGYKVLEADSGDVALKLMRKHNEHVHLLITDVVMPGITGRQLADRLKPLRPEMQVLYMSGYSENVIGDAGKLEPGLAFLAKPFTVQELLEKVRAALGSVRQG